MKEFQTDLFFRMIDTCSNFTPNKFLNNKLLINKFVDLIVFIVLVCGNTMCYLNYREAEVQVLKRTEVCTGAVHNGFINVCTYIYIRYVFMIITGMG